MRNLNGTALKLVVAESLRGLGTLVDDGAYAKHGGDNECSREPQHQLRLQGTEPRLHSGCSTSK
jgi:hypothetical protein